MTENEEGDARLVGEIVHEAGGRISHVEVLSSGERFLLARARHPHTKRTVLLMATRPGFSDGTKQLSMISGMLTACAGAGLGEVVDRYWARDDPSRWGCLALPWHEGATTLQSFVVLGPENGQVDVLAGFRDVVRQVAAMHVAGYVHGDISLGNILVSATGMHLADFEYVTNSKFLASGDAFYTSTYSPPARLPAMRNGRYSIADAKAWDRFALGRVALQIITHANPYKHSSLTLYNQRALRLIAGLLMGKSASSQDFALGLSEEFYSQNAYSDLEEAIGALDRLCHSVPVEHLIPEISAVPPSVVEVGLTHPVAFTDRVRRLVETPQMQQLTSCQQLGLVSFIWPTATHTRLQHALGTFGMACDAVANLYEDPQSPFFRVLVAPSTARSLLAAALLHDVGHYPLAHDLEEAYPGVFDHEPRSVRFIESGPIAEVLADPENDAVTPGWEIKAEDVASIVEGRPRPGSSLSRGMVEMLHSVLSGALDVDKLDYLVRDSRALGVAAGGGLDIPRVLSSLTIALVPDPERKDRARRLRLAVRSKGIRPAELVGRVRSHMFGVAYWHHSYRAIKSMIHWLVWSRVGRGDREHKAIEKRASELAERLFVALDVDPSASQPTLPGFEESTRGGRDPMPDLMAEPVRSRMPAPEAAVLGFVTDLNDTGSAEILRLLGERSWYRSVLTVEHFQNIAATDEGDEDAPERIWTYVERLKGLSPSRQVIFRSDLCIEVQRSLYEWFDQHPDEPDTTQIVDWRNVRHRFLARAGDWQLALVDLVETRKSRDKPLYFVPNERPGSRLTDTAKPLLVRRSFDQQQLQDEFIVSNGAIRVLVHPEFDKLVSDSVSERELLRILDNAVDATLAKNAIGRPRIPVRRRRSR